MNDALMTGLSPAEESYFESGGTIEIPSSEQGAETEVASGDGPNTDANNNGDSKECEPKVEKMVTLEALHKERSRRKDIDKQNRGLQQQVADLQGKVSIIDRLLPSPQQVKPPTLEDDIFGVVKHTTEVVAELKKRLEDRDAQEKAAIEQNNLVSAYRADAAQFEAKTPDFNAAYRHLLQSRAQELIAIGYDDPQALHQALLAEEMGIVKTALAGGRSAAEIIYNLALQRGYKKVESGKAKVADKLDMIERGRQAHKSLSNTGGGAGDGEMTAETLLKMPMDEFEAWCNKNPVRAKRIMGG